MLPASLQQLKLERWRQSLSAIALPASLVELDIRYLDDYPLPALPPQLQVLRIGGAFRQPLTGVLPAALRVLRLTGAFDQPLTADVFASAPLLEELWLSDYSTGSQHALPRTLRVLRLGKRSSLSMRELSEALPELRKLKLPPQWDVARVKRFEQFGQARGIAVPQSA